MAKRRFNCLAESRNCALNTAVYRLTRRTWISTLMPSLALWSWGNYLKSLILSFCIFKMKEIVLDSSSCWVKHMRKIHVEHWHNVWPMEDAQQMFPSTSTPYLDQGSEASEVPRTARVWRSRDAKWTTVKMHSAACLMLCHLPGTLVFVYSTCKL